MTCCLVWLWLILALLLVPLPGALGAAHAAPAAPAAGPATQLKDISAGAAVSSALRLGFSTMVPVGKTLFFSACPEQRCGLWKSDGTTAGTAQVAALDADSKTALDGLINVGGKLFFTTVGGSGLWKSDGTTTGTAQISSASVARPSSFSRPLPFLADANGTLFFSANGNELWKSDGTAAGTVRVLAMPSGNSQPQRLISVNGKLFFTTALVGATDLWKSDGTAAGTVRVKTFADSYIASSVQGLTNLNGTLFFTAYSEDTSANELWKSDGSAVGTVRVTDGAVLNIDSYYNTPPGYSTLTNVNGTLFFAAGEYSQQGLWKSDGTAAGTQLVRSLTNVTPVEMTSANGRLFFCNGSSDGFCSELWTSDGTEQGTVLIASLDIRAWRWNTLSSSFADIPTFTVVGKTVFFPARSESNSRYDLWKSDGTVAGTVLVKQVPLPTDQYTPNPQNAAPSFMANLNGTLFFEFDNAEVNEQYSSTLWKSDGSTAGTTQVQRTLTTPASSRPAQLTNVNGTLFFSADDGVSGRELWKSDGSAAGTVRVKDINPGAAAAFFSEDISLVVVKGSVFFLADDGTSGYELWKSDGSAAGTVRVKDINPGSGNAILYNPIAMNNTLFFSATDGTSGQELWKSDGTAADTVRVKDINPGSGDATPYGFMSMNNTLFFTASDGTSGQELWKSDDTEQGTVRVKDIRTGSGDSSAYPLATVGNTLFLVADDGVSGRELWKSDGTAAGTVRVKDLTPGTCQVNSATVPCDTRIFDAQNVNGQLYVMVTHGVTGTTAELWKSNGSEAGTTLVFTFTSAVGTPWSEVALMNNKLYFMVNKDHNDYLWTSDGTAAGTLALKTFALIDGQFWSGLRVVNDKLFFGAEAGTSGVELWQSDGSAAGTAQVQDLAPGATDSYPTGMLAINGRLFFAATGSNGTELWSQLLNGTNLQPRVFLPLTRR